MFVVGVDVSIRARSGTTSAFAVLLVRRVELCMLGVCVSMCVYVYASRAGQLDVPIRGDTWTCYGHVIGMLLACYWHVSGMLQACYRHVTVIGSLPARKG
jgi:hypothetical protein